MCFPGWSARFDRLDRLQPASPNPKVVKLAQALVARFPSELGGQQPRHTLRLEDLPNGVTGGSDVYSLGLHDDGIQRLLPAC